MDGTLSVESEVGKGSTFTFELELQMIKRAKVKTKKGMKKITEYKGKRKRLLVVDDNSTNLDMLVLILEALGFEINTAKDGQQAINRVLKEPPDLLLLDLLMPIMNGDEVAHQLKSKKSTREIKIVGVSAAVADKQRLEQFAALCDDFISKPVNIDMLLETLQRQLEIEWVEESDEVAAETVTLEDEQEIKFPPKTVLKNILAATELGDFSMLERELDKLDKETAYSDFCRKIRKYVKMYDDEGIIDYINAK
jgi:CheY-like chemotaxis protein